MKTKRELRAPLNLRVLLFLQVFAALLVVFSACNQGKKPETTSSEIAPPQPPPVTQAKDTVYSTADVMPEFPGGDAALLKYIGENTVYPDTAKRRGIQGRVVVQFVVKADGNVGNASIIRGVDPLLDNEALRVVKTIPKFQPGIKDGKAVAVNYAVPISYTLK